MPAAFEPVFLMVNDTALGARISVLHMPAADRPLGLIVHVHPFAEEMNKARRMTAMQSRGLAAAGYAVLRIDLLGCGDSAGDFGDASWVRWVDDVVAAVRWLETRYATRSAEVPLWLWGLRAGSLLATEAGARLAACGARCNFLFWQPATQGKVLLHQFLRLKAAGELLTGQSKAAMTRVRAEISAGRPVEVAGYRLSPGLCHGMEQATLHPPPAMTPGRVVWLEVSAASPPGLLPTGAATMAAWQDCGWAVQSQAVHGPAFWKTSDVEDAPALLEATLAALTAQSGARSAELTAP